jgi:hypothetical protein
LRFTANGDAIIGANLRDDLAVADRYSTLRAISVAIAFAGVLSIAKSAQPEAARTPATRLVLQIQRADYEGDRDDLKRLYDQMGRLADQKDKAQAARIHYWRGFALWRRALNGFNESATPPDLEQDLKLAVAEFESSSAADPHFVDAKIGAASCLANLAVLAYKAGQGHALDLLNRSNALLKDAQAEQPDNPRLLWVLGANQWYAPPERGGGHATAIETYQKGLKAAAVQNADPSDILNPSWGKPELLMNLAWANLHMKPPDLTAAEHNARAALELVPYWHYVRDILLPDIETAKKKPR